MPTTSGAIAAGHRVTAEAAAEILHDGGNAFDAIIAAHFAACVAEPVLASLAGGGYMLAKPAYQTPIIYDFFVQTPSAKQLPHDLDFFPIQADFGTVSQEFHIGLGSLAVPGSVKGIFSIHRDLCTLPLTRLAEPAIKAAKLGVHFNHLQAEIFKIVGPIYAATAEARRTYASPSQKDTLVAENDLFVQPLLADTLDALAREGEQLFYQGEIAEKIHQLCLRGGGHLRREDLHNYRVFRREALALTYRNAKLFTNPPPSSGGILIALALKLLENSNVAIQTFGHNQHLDLLASVMAETNQARMDILSNKGGDLASHLLDRQYIEQYRSQVSRRARCLRGTTHIGVMDNHGNTAAMTVSNGEGCGYMAPNTGIMLNNMLGEEDLNPGGFHCWRENQRMTSMMAPSLLVLNNGTSVALGSGGSNRIRTALLQVISNLVDFAMPPEEAVVAPRIHFENGLLNIEPGFEINQLNGLTNDYPNQKRWQQCNLFFGGVHTVEFDGNRFHGVGDPRRGGVGLSLD